MKPFTLAWWLKIYEKAIERVDYMSFYGYNNQYADAEKLLNYIEQRIINKYGEQ